MSRTFIGDVSNIDQSLLIRSLSNCCYFFVCIYFVWYFFQYFMCLLRLFPFSHALTMIYEQTIVTKFVLLNFVLFFIVSFVCFTLVNAKKAWEKKLNTKSEIQKRKTNICCQYSDDDGTKRYFSTSTQTNLRLMLLYLIRKFTIELS